jgi:hypothetical protein
MGTQFRWKTLTNAEGDYTVPYLSPGSYRITLEAKGFKTLIRDNIVIRTGETPRVDIAMELGAVTEAVEVSAVSPLLGTDTAIVGQIMESSTLQNVEAPQGHAIRLLVISQQSSTTELPETGTLPDRGPGISPSPLMGSARRHPGCPLSGM